jgi:hypothetical protein
MTSPKNRDLIDLIADSLPQKEGAAYYREMMYCRSLPEDDELLRVLRVMQYLTLLIERVPERVAAERKRMQGLLSRCLEQFASSFQASESSRLLLDQRLVQLHGFIAAGISPETIVTEINSQLEKRFSSSTIPQLGDRLTETAIKINVAISALDGTMEKARKAIDHVNETVSRAAEAAERAAKRLSAGFHQQYWWSVFLLTTTTLFVGIFAGMLLMYSYDHPAQKIERPDVPVIHNVPPVKARK